MKELRRRYRQCPCPWRYRAFGAVTLVIVLTMLLAGCSTSPQPLAPLPSLHLPGVVQLDAVAQLEAKTGNHAINSILAYRSMDSAATTHILYSGNGALYDIHLDGTGLRQIQMQPYCISLGTVDAQGEHGLCWAKPGLQAFDLNDTASAWPPRILVPHAPASSEVFTSPTFAPDGRHFAALHHDSAESPASINIYAVNHSTTVANLVAEIILPYSRAQRVLWSPDSKWLAFTTDETTATMAAGATYAFQIASILPTLPAQQSQPFQITLSKPYITKLEDGIDATNVWRPAGENAIWTYVKGGTIWQLDIVSGQRTSLLTISDGGICGLEWTPDGRQLVFAQCRLAGLAEPPPAHLYVCTPSAA